jgi:hypothetical protein
MCVLLLPRITAAKPFRQVDFDGDGRRDRFKVDRLEPSVLRIWLSASDTTHTIRTRVPLLQVVATDLDGDHRPELIARDRDSQLHVWTRKRNRFKLYRPQHVRVVTVRQPDDRTYDQNGQDAPVALTTTLFTPYALMLCASPRAPGPETFAAPTFDTAPARRSSTALAPFASRPPPTHPC